MKSAYEYMADAWKRPAQAYKPKMRAMKARGAIERIDRPTRLNRARALGYKAKQGFAVAQVMIRKGGRKKQKAKKARKPLTSGNYYDPMKSHQAIAEMRVSRKFPNMEVLNSYYVGEDGEYDFFEVILVDPHSPVIQADKHVSWTIGQKGRAFRGLTSAGRKSRGL
jgi:large subunit ribosomal protein L15e